MKPTLTIVPKHECVISLRKLRIRKWRTYWRDSVFVRSLLRRRGCNIFSIEHDYYLLKIFVRTEQKRGAI